MTGKKSNWTIPNALCVSRLVGSFLLIPIAIVGLRYWFVGVYLLLVFTDLIDGQLARWLKQQSDLGARLDSIADVVLNGCLLLGVSILCWESFQNELLLIGAAVTSYFISAVTCLWKFGRFPAYHTIIAKTTQWLTAIAAVSLTLGWSVWPLRVTAISSVLANVEGTAITLLIDRWRADVLTFFGAQRRKDGRD
jgi:CDP-diacylglycerol--glycerol-3-phosphate 3-phosphatidyltransferase